MDALVQAWLDVLAPPGPSDIPGGGSVVGLVASMLGIKEMPQVRHTIFNYKSFRQ